MVVSKLECLEMFIVGREVSKQMFTVVRICCLGNKIAASRSSDCRIFVYMLKSDMVAVLAVLPRYPRYYRGNGYNFYGITAVLWLSFSHVMKIIVECACKAVYTLSASQCKL